VLERKEHAVIFGLLAGEYGGVFTGADRDITGGISSASQREQGPEPHSAPALADPAPSLVAVKVRDQFGVHQRAQFRRSEASGPLDVTTD
jgi:hypothetical protein